MTSTQPKRPNYFLLLELDPDAPWSDPIFEQALKSRMAEWTRRRNHPKHALRYKSYLDMVDHIRAIMTDPVHRTSEQATARQILTDLAAEKMAAFREDLELLAAKGFFTRKEIADLHEQYKKAIPRRTIQAEIEQLELEIREDEAPPEKRDKLEPSTLKNIANNLQIVGAADLYDFLQLTRSTRTVDLHERASAIYADNQKQANKTAIVTARSDLAGQAMNIFAGNDSRERYDNALADAAYAELGDAVQRITRSSKTIYDAQFEKLLERARSQGLDLNAAEQYIRQRAQELQAAIFVTQTSTIAARRRCPNCHTLADPDATNCPECGTALILECPSCSRIMPTEYKACTNCGFPIGNLSNVQVLLSEAKLAYEQGVVNHAEDLIKQARRQWTPRFGASQAAGGATRLPRDPLSAELADLEEAIRAERQAQANALDHLTRLINQHRYYTARDILQRVQQEQPGLNVSQEETLIQEAIQQAEADLQRARLAETRGEDATPIYQQIIWACRDCQAAQEALASTPPHPPADLKIATSGALARLSWSASSTPGVRYTVLRKYDARPISPADGEVLGTTTGTTLDDNTALPGQSVFYAVYSDREGVLSTEAAMSDTPILFTAEVRDLYAQVADSVVRLRWENPKNFTRIICTRDGDSTIRIYGPNNAHDEGLRNGQTYTYTVQVVFTAHNGREIITDGVTISATPQKPPPIIKDIQIRATHTGDQRELHVSWSRVNKGEAILLYGTARPNLRPGQAVPQEKLNPFGTVIPAPGGQATLNISGAGIIYLTPLILFQDLAYPGHTQAYTALDDIHNLKVQNIGFALQLNWEWPANCQHADIVYRHDRYPTPDDRDATRIPITRAAYDLHGRYLIEQPAQRDYFITVYAVLMQDGQRLVSSGREPTCRQRISLSSAITLTYHIDRPRRLSGPRPLVLTVEATGTGDLPELVLVRKKDTLPLNRTDGQPIARIEGRQLDQPATTISLELDAAIEQDGHFARLFLTDDELYQSRGGYVRIYQPNLDHLRVF
jgi:hypothetical protein